MRRRVSLLTTVALFWAVVASFGATVRSQQIELANGAGQWSRASARAGQLGDKLGALVVFEGTDDLHYYARADTTPAPGMELKVAVAAVPASPTADGVTFGNAIFPKWKFFRDPAMDTDIEVYAGNFSVFVPIQSRREGLDAFDVEVTVSGVPCTSQVCLMPFTKKFPARIDLSPNAAVEQVTFESAEQITPDPAKTHALSGNASFSRPIAFLLAFIAGISINLMPCVLPIIPLIIMRLVEQTREASSRRFALGTAFCGGIVLFFVAFAVAVAIVKAGTGMVINWSDFYRYPNVVIGMFLVVVLVGLFLLDVFTVSLPSSVTDRQGSGQGITGSVGMGFFAAVLSTPCSGAILAMVMVWAQTQPAAISIIAIILMGVGMALPYAILVAFPGLLDSIPKPGAWMDLFRKGMGLLLLFVAARLMLPALDKDRIVEVIKYAVIFSFCVWMWGGWVNLSMSATKKWTVRFIAVAIAVLAGAWYLPAASTDPQQAAIAWQKYDRAEIEKASAGDEAVLLKFTADWCTNCKVVDKRVYHDRDVIEIINRKGVTAIIADTTVINYPATEDLSGVYGIPGTVPVTILLLPGGRVEKLVGIFDKRQLMDILETLSDTGGG